MFLNGHTVVGFMETCQRSGIMQSVFKKGEWMKPAKLSGCKPVVLIIQAVCKGRLCMHSLQSQTANRKTLRI